MNATTTSSMGSIAPTTNAKILNAASLLMTYLIACGTAWTAKFFARNTPNQNFLRHG